MNEQSDVKEEVIEKTFLDRMRLLHFSHPFLNKRPEPFNFEVDGDKAKDLATDLVKAMFKFGGVGLSANQVGFNWRVFVFGTEDTQFAMFNPQIIAVSQETEVFEEGCLSFPDFKLTLTRPAAVGITYQDVDGVWQTANFSGVSARIIQHEYDHMEGINFTHHASEFKLKRELKKWQNVQKKKIRNMSQKVH